MRIYSVHHTFIYIILILLLIPALLFSGQVLALEEVSLQLSWKYQFEYAGFIMAREKGYYKEAGLQVELEEYTIGTDIVQDVLTGKNNYGTHNSSVIVNNGKLEPVILLATYLQQSPLVFVVSKDINSPKDLIGKVISGTRDELKYSSLGQLLSHFFITEENTKFVEHSFGIEDFVNHKVDVMTAFRTNQLYLLDERNIEYNIIDPADYGFVMTAVNLFTSYSEAVNHPERTKRFIDASNKGWLYALQHVEETIDVILQKYSTQKSREALRYEATVTRKMMLLDFFEIGETNKELSLRAESQFHHSGLLNPDQKLDKFLFEEVVKDINSSDLFTDQQKSYLKNKKEITYCIDPEWMPFESIHNGKHIGISADIFDGFKKQLPVPMHLIKTQSWVESLFKVQQRECDILSLASPTTERLKYLDFTQPYINLPVVLVTRTDKIFIDDINEVKNEKLAVVKGYAIADILREKINDINLIEVDSISDGLKRVESGEVYGYVDNLMVVANSIQTEFTGVLKVSSRLNEQVQLAIGIRKDEPQLKEIFNILIQQLSEKDIQKTFNRWVAVQDESRFNYSLVWKFLLIILVIIAGYLIHYIKLKKLNLALLKLSVTDPLTGLFNRLKMDEVLIQQQAALQRYHVNTSLILIDIDFFKKVNDNYGHHVGDQLLIDFSRLLKSNVRVTDIVGRWGGEEFLIICPNINKKGAGELAEKLLEKVRDYYFYDVGRITVSAGVSELERDQVIQKILIKVDDALYFSKHNGRDQVSFSD